MNEDIRPKDRHKNTILYSHKNINSEIFQFPFSWMFVPCRTVKLSDTPFMMSILPMIYSCQQKFAQIIL